MTDEKHLRRLLQEIGDTALVETPIDFEFHLDERDASLASRLEEDIRIINIDGRHVEFGFERDNGKVVIELGFAKVAVKKRAFEEAAGRLRKRDRLLGMLNQYRRAGPPAGRAPNTSNNEVIRNDH